ncbi:MAG: RNA 2',3'-cyclic phosphodiesterase [Clostridiales bacterium]|nr:RNA 2',3'-cyclic phosphodiesterase [Clostridiales bacterium]
MRVFYAITFKRESKEKLALYRDTLINHTLKGKFIETDNLHLTLEFIGDIKISDLHIYENILDELPLSKPVLKVVHAGTFPKKNRAILWLGLEKNVILNQLVENLHLLMSTYDIEYDKRKYQAHITIGRQVLLSQSLEEFILPPLILEVESVALMHSHRVHDRLTYEPIYQKFFNNSHF